ncbi:glycosyl hydrolase family 10 [Apiospora sp. TS-2023a]
MHLLNSPAATAAVVLALSGSVSAQLNQLAKAAGKLYFGTAIHGEDLNDSSQQKYLGDSNDFGQATPGNEMKWDATEPNRGQFTFGNGDKIANFASSHGQMLRCHTLVWYAQLPGWVQSGNWNKDSLTSVINTHISNVVGHYKGKCYAWDVVNEALNEDGSYRSNPFLKVLGDSYFAIAFDAAAKADPNTKLYYNAHQLPADYNLETLSPKQQGAVKIVKLVKAAGKRIDGVGMQAHLIVGQSPTASTLQSVMQSYLDAGATEVAFTELDIRFSRLPSTAAGLQQQAEGYGAVTTACLAVKGCVGITTWGWSDAHSWVPGTFPGNGDALIYDRSYKKKPAYSTISSILAAAKTAGGGGGGEATAAPTTTTLVTSTTTAAQPPPATTTSDNGGGGCVSPQWAQCGGQGWAGCKTCASGLTCKINNDYYSQCV